MSSLCIIRGEPGRWEGVAVDSGLAVVGPSFAQVRRCLAEIVQPTPAACASIDATLRRLETKLRRVLFLASHFSYLLQRRFGLGGQFYESHLIRNLV